MTEDFRVTKMSAGEKQLAKHGLKIETVRTRAKRRTGVKHKRRGRPPKE